MNRPAENRSQSEVFLHGEADAYFERNKKSHSDALQDPWNTEISQYLRPGNRILEIGCSDARRMAAIETLTSSDCHFAGVDPSAGAIEEGQRKYPHFDLKIGTADSTGFAKKFDVVIFGFCLYLCDRESLLSIVSHADQLLCEGGVLIIEDFDPPYPTKRPYTHLDGVWSYKMDYPSIFASLPNYSIDRKLTRSNQSLDDCPQEIDADNRTALTILRKHASDGYLINFPSH